MAWRLKPNMWHSKWLRIDQLVSNSSLHNLIMQIQVLIHFGGWSFLYLQFEDNIRTIALSSDWVKLVDDWSVEYSATQNAASTSGTAQKRGPGRRGKKQCSMPELADDNGHEKSFVWWQGGQYSKLVFQKAILPCSMVKRAARQGNPFTLAITLSTELRSYSFSTWTNHF